MPTPLFEKGNPGKPKGATNLLTRTVKETVLAAFNELQKDPKANLIAWGKTKPGEFYQIAAKLIPTEISAKFEGKVINVVHPSERNKDENETED